MDFKGNVIYILSVIVILFDCISCNNMFDHQQLHHPCCDNKFHNQESHNPCVQKLHTNVSCESVGGGFKVILHSRCPECASMQTIHLFECNSTTELLHRKLNKLDQETTFYGLPEGSYRIMVQRDCLFIPKTNCCRVKQPDKPHVPHSTPIIVIIVGCVILVLVVIITPCIVINKLDNVSRQNEMSESNYTRLLNIFRESTTSSRSVYV